MKKVQTFDISFFMLKVYLNKEYLANIFDNRQADPFF